MLINAKDVCNIIGGLNVNICIAQMASLMTSANNVHRQFLDNLAKSVEKLIININV